MKIGRISLNVPAIADISEQEFYTLVKGSIDIDKKVAWELFQKEAEPFKKKVEPMSDEQRILVYDRVKVCREWLNIFHESYQTFNQ